MLTGQDFEIIAGDTEPVAFTVTGPDGFTLIGSTIRWWMAPSQTTPPNDVPVKKESPGDITITSATAFEVMILPADTAALRSGQYYHEAEVTLATGAVKTIATGKVKVLPTLIPPP